jgi:hypothetical protein
VANQLEANLVSNFNQLIQGETLILDASNSLITNMPLNSMEKALAYDWNCPEPFVDICAVKTGNQISFDFNEAIQGEGF